MIGAHHKLKNSGKLLKLLLCWGSDLLLIAGVAAVGYAVSILAVAWIYQARELSKFEHEVILPASRIPPVGDSIGEIDVPSIALRAVVIQGSSPQVLRLGVGHIYETPLPGKPGNVVLAAHRDTFFRPLRRIRAGDIILLRTGEQTIRYQVRSTSVVSPANVDILKSSDGNELTLVTCFPFDYVGPAPRRFIVHAEETTAPAE